ncbi:MAG: ECF transporter S component [Prevotella sp.]
MNKESVTLYQLGYRDLRCYLVAALFVAGNILLPQLFHLIPDGGKTWLPIYFFTLVGACKFGWRVGLLTACASPVVNALLFGMPMPAVLPAILLKSVLLALAAGYLSYKHKKVSIGMLLCVVLLYQGIGTMGEWLMTGNLFLALQDFRLGIPGMTFQVIGGYGIIRYVMFK